MPRPVAIVLVLLLSFLAYAPALGNDFAFDDTLARATTNDHKVDRVISKLHGPWFYFASQYWLGEDRESRLYRPLTIYSYALTYHLISKPLLPEDWEAFPHHLLNLLLNVWATYLVLWMMRDLGVGFGPSLLAAALFGVHALHSEVVAGIVGRAELFAFCLGMAFLWAWRRSSPVTASVLFFLALSSKENAVAWCGLLPCYLLARAWRSDPGATVPGTLRPCLLRMALVCGVPLVLFLLLRHNAIQGWRPDVFYTANPLYHEPLDVRLLTAIKVWGLGLYKCVAPFSLACLYSLQAITLVKSVLDPGFLCALVVLSGSLVVGLWRPNRRPLLFLSVAIFFGFSCITANVLFAVGTIFGERLYFIPSLGVCLVPALLLERLESSPARKIVLGACVLWMGASVVVDWDRSRVWKDNESLMLHDAAVQPDSASLQVKAASVHRWLAQTEPKKKAEHNKRAWELLRRAQHLDPDYVNALLTEATFLGQDGRHDEALAIMRRSLLAKRLARSGLEAQIRGEMAMLLIHEKGQREAGVRELQRAVELRPRHVQMRLHLLEYGKGVLTSEELERQFEETARLAPENLFLWTLRADYIYQYGERNAENAKLIVDLLEGVFASLSEEATREKLMVTARLQLARCLEGLGRREDAIRSYQILLSLKEATKEQKDEAGGSLRQLLRQQ